MEITVVYSDDDLGMFRHHQNALMYFMTIDEVYNFCRSKLKYEENIPPEVDKVCEEIKDMVTEAYNRSMEN